MSDYVLMIRAFLPLYVNIDVCAWLKFLVEVFTPMRVSRRCMHKAILNMNVIHEKETLVRFEMHKTLLLRGHS